MFAVDEHRSCGVQAELQCNPYLATFIAVSDAIQEVLPGELRLPPSRSAGTDPWKLHQQIRQFGASTSGMPPILVYQDPDGLIIDGVTRATRITKLAPEQPVPVIIIGRYRRSRANSPRVKDRL